MGLVRGIWEPSPAQVGLDTVDPSHPQAEATMEQCASVEREVDKVLQKFLTYGQHCEQSLEELLRYVGQLRAELAGTGVCPSIRALHSCLPRGPGKCRGCLMTGFQKDGGLKVSICVPKASLQ